MIWIKCQIKQNTVWNLCCGRTDNILSSIKYARNEIPLQFFFFLNTLVGNWVCHSSALCWRVWSSKIAWKPNFLLCGREALVRSSDWVLLVIGIKACGKSCTLFSFHRGFPLLLPAVEVEEVRGFVSRVVPLVFFKLHFLQLAMAGSTPCIRVLGKHCLWIILLTVIVLSCGLAGTSKCLQEPWIQFGRPSLKHDFHTESMWLNLIN